MRRFWLRPYNVSLVPIFICRKTTKRRYDDGNDDSHTTVAHDYLGRVFSFCSDLTMHSFDSSGRMGPSKNRSFKEIRAPGQNGKRNPTGVNCWGVELFVRRHWSFSAVALQGSRKSLRCVLSYSRIIAVCSPQFVRVPYRLFGCLPCPRISNSRCLEYLEWYGIVCTYPGLIDIQSIDAR